jgi:hypothetical protein
MISVQEHLIHCVNGKCVVSAKKMIPTHSSNNDYTEIYGKNDSHRRFENLGLPIFVVQSKDVSEPIVQESNYMHENNTISDELFDTLFEKVEKKSNSKSKKLSKKQKKISSNDTKKNKKSDKKSKN